MLPDPKTKWLPFASVIDGLDNPSVSVRGVEDGKIYLVVECSSVSAWYGVSVEYWAYAVFDESFYSLIDTGDHASCYAPDNYIRVAANSSSLENFPSDVLKLARHFLFPGLDECVEVIARSEPEIQVFDSKTEADFWGPVVAISSTTH